MAKFQGKVGYVRTEETSPGVYEAVVTEKSCTGDLLRNSQRISDGENLNPKFTINNRFSFLANAFANANLHYIAYLEWRNIKWAVSNVEIQYPRLILTVNGVYNG